VVVIIILAVYCYNVMALSAECIAFTHQGWFLHGCKVLGLLTMYRLLKILLKLSVSLL